MCRRASAGDSLFSLMTGTGMWHIPVKSSQRRGIWRATPGRQHGARRILSKASPFESEIHPSHKSCDLFSGYFAPAEGRCHRTRHEEFIFASQAPMIFPQNPARIFTKYHVRLLRMDARKRAYVRKRSPKVARTKNIGKRISKEVIFWFATHLFR